jgi:hypothetical protein
VILEAADTTKSSALLLCQTTFQVTPTTACAAPISPAAAGAVRVRATLLSTAAGIIDSSSLLATIEWVVETDPRRSVFESAVAGSVDSSSSLSGDTLSFVIQPPLALSSSDSDCASNSPLGLAEVLQSMRADADSLRRPPVRDVANAWLNSDLTNRLDATQPLVIDFIHTGMPPTSHAVMMPLVDIGALLRLITGVAHARPSAHQRVFEWIVLAWRIVVFKVDLSA